MNGPQTLNDMVYVIESEDKTVYTDNIGSYVKRIQTDGFGPGGLEFEFKRYLARFHKLTLKERIYKRLGWTRCLPARAARDMDEMIEIN
jgi:hypothetical protein